MPRLLILADLHYRKPWFDWLADNVSAFGSVVLAGDLISHPKQFGSSPYLPDWDGGPTPSHILQAYHIGERLKECKPRFLAACSGNHDIPDLFTGYLVGPAACVDGETKHLPSDGIVFTSIPFVDENGRSSVTLDAAWPATPPPISDFWILLHHVPPLGINLCPRAKGHHALEARLRATGTRTPDLVCCGHFHHPPGWCERIGTSWVVNPGSLDSNESTELRPIPPHIIADLNTRTLTWHSGIADCAPVLQSLDA